jgi:hypothetical protein
MRHQEAAIRVAMEVIKAGGGADLGDGGALQ